jgi:uncharacterized protein
VSAGAGGHVTGVDEPEAVVTFAPELRMFLRPGLRHGRVKVACDGVSSLGHVVESLGVPLTEVGSLAVNGRPARPGYRPAGGDVAEARPVPRPQRPAPARFILDVHLGTLARRLRLVGVDAAYANDTGDDELIERANSQRRVLLTQDRGLLRRHKLWLGAYVRGARPDDQLADVLGRFAPPLAPWTRCTACNGLLAPARKADVEPLLQPGTRRTYHSFARCQECGRVYWRGAHSRKLAAVVETARRLSVPHETMAGTVPGHPEGAAMPDDGARDVAAEPEDLGRLFLARASAGDVDGVVALYEPGAVLAGTPRGLAAGHAEIREFYQALLGARPAFSGEVRPALRLGDLALTSTRFPGGATAEIARRQPDGSWLWVADQPNITA